MIKLEHVTKIYDDKIFALDDVSLDFNSYGLHVITGETGSGKSTLLNSIFTLETIDKGTITINNIILNELSNRKKEEIRDKYFSFIFQEYNLIEDMTVKENLEVVLPRKNKDIDSDIKYVLERVGLSKYINTTVKKLSGGERQRVAIARALIKKSIIILADEPTGSLDDENGRIIMDIFKEISKDHLVILVTHNLKCATEYADRLITIKKGKIVQDKIINDTTQIQSLNFNYEINKKDFHVVKNFFITNLRNSYLKTLYTIIIFGLFILINLIAISLLTVNPEKSYLEYIKKVNYQYLYLCTENDDYIDYFKYQELDEKIKRISYPSVSFARLYFENLDFRSDLIIIDNEDPSFSIDDDKIVITDYLAMQIINIDLNDEYVNISDLIGAKLKYNDYDLYISDIKETNYHEFNNLELYDYYRSGFINKNTLENIFSPVDINLITNINYNDNTTNRLYDVQIKLNSQLNDKEIIVSKSLFAKLENAINIEFVSDARRKIRMNFENIEVSESDDDNTFYVSENYYNLLKEFSYDGSIFINVDKINSKFILYLKSKGLYILTDYKTNYINLVNIKKITLLPLIIFNVIMLIILIQIYYKYIFQRIQSRKKDYIILKCIGNASTINKIITYEISFTIIISTVIATLFYLMIASNINNILNDIFKFAIYISIIMPIMIVIFISVFSIFIMRFILLEKIYKTKELDVIK